MISLGSLFQSTIVLGKNDYIVFKTVFSSLNCWNVRSFKDRDGRVVGRKILVAGMDRWGDHVMLCGEPVLFFLDDKETMNPTPI